MISEEANPGGKTMQIPGGDWGSAAAEAKADKLIAATVRSRCSRRSLGF